MSKGGLRFLAVFLSALIVIVLFAGLDNLPRDVRAEIAAERRKLADGAAQIEAAKAEVAKEAAASAALFHARGLDATLNQRVARAEEELRQAQQEMAALAPLEKKNRRQDLPEVRQRLSRERGLCSDALSDASAARTEADHWAEMERDLPKTLERMEKAHAAIRAVDYAGVIAAVEKAETDWPQKKSDLETRLAAVRAYPADAEKQWEKSAALRAQAKAKDYEHLDFEALYKEADELDAAAAAAPKKGDELKALTAQLYDSWDKVLVDLDRQHRDYREKIRTVRTHQGETTSDEQWVEVSKADYQRVEKNLGMVVQHKAAGEYDSEADQTAQPPGFAYMAAPAQGSNQYGHWEHSGGQSFWVWYGQYALLRDLLFHRDYRPVGSGEYDEFRAARRSGETYYGHAADGLPKWGSGGAVTREKYAASEYARSGGFKSSKFARRSGGGYADSKFQPPGYRHRETPGGSWRTPKPSSPSRSFGRSFGRSAPRSLGRGLGRAFGRR